MYLPSEEIYKELRVEPSGIWFAHSRGSDTHAILLKSPLNALKSLIKGSVLRIGFSVKDTPDGKVLMSAMYIHDDTESPLITISSHIQYDQQLTLLEILRKCSRPRVFFYDELARNVASAQCYFNDQRLEVVNLMGSLSEFYVGDPNHSVIQALDHFEKTAGGVLKHDTLALREIIMVELSLKQFQEYHIYAVGNQEVGYFNIAQENEGDGLEQSVCHLLEELFGSNIYRCPQVLKGKKYRELTDVLATTGLGTFLIESKSISVIGAGPAQTKARKAKNIESHIKKGLNQLVGAVKSIRDGRKIQTSEGIEIIVNQDLVPHGIVLISEMFPFLDWDSVVTQLMEAALKSKAMLHIVDLREFTTLVTASKSADTLDYYLMQRFEQVVEKQSVFVRVKFKKG